MANRIISDLLGTLKSTFRINRATVDASGLSAARTFTLPDIAGTVKVTGRTRWHPIINWATLPDSSGDVFVEPYSVKATNDVWDSSVFVFNDTSTKISLHGRFTVPKDYSGAAKIIPVWTSTATSGNAVWVFEYRVVSGDDTTSLDQSGTQESANVTDAAPGAAHRRLEPSIALTAGNLSAGATVEFKFSRDGTSGSDTMAAAALLFDLLFEYTDAY